AYLAFAGRLDPRERFDRLRAIAALGVLPLHLVVRAGSGVTTVSDLRGHSVGIGVPDSGTQLISRSLLTAFGLDLRDIRPRSVAIPEAVESLRAGELDAFFALGPFPESVRAALRSGARLVPIKGSAADALRARNRFVRLAVIPAGTYETQGEP